MLAVAYCAPAAWCEQYAPYVQMQWSVIDEELRTVRVDWSFCCQPGSPVYYAQYWKLYYPVGVQVQSNTYNTSPGQPWDSGYEELECPVTGLYTMKWTLQLYAGQGTYSGQYQWWINWEDLDGDGEVQGPPDPEDEGTWWNWLWNLFTLSSEEKLAWQDLWDDLCGAGPLGDMTAVQERFDDTETTPQPYDDTWAFFPVLQARSASGAPIGYTALIEDLPIPGLNWNVAVPPCETADGNTPWQGVNTLQGWWDTWRNVFGWGLCCLFLLAVVCWVGKRL